MPVDWLVNQLEWLTNQFFARAGLALVWMLTCLPPGLGYVGYIVVALWLSGWVSSIRTTRSSVLATSARRALVKVVLPVDAPPATRMLRRSETAVRSATAWLAVMMPAVA